MRNAAGDWLLSRGLLFYIALALIPLLISEERVITYFIYILIYSILTIGLSLLMGYAGQVSAGHAAFFGIGAYVSSILAVRFHVPFAAGFVAAGVVTGIVGYLVGFPALRLRGLYLAVMTFAFGEVVYALFVGLDDWTGGPNGLIGVPRAELAGYVFSSTRSYFYLALGTFVLVFLSAQNLVNSRVGRALRALHGSELGATALGIDVSKYKVRIFALSSGYAGLAGSLFAHFFMFIAPPSFGAATSAIVLAMVILGGAASLWGALMGAALLTILPLFLEPLKDYELLVYGVIMILVLIFMPKGLYRGVEDLVRYRRNPFTMPAPLREVVRGWRRARSGAEAIVPECLT